MTQQGRPVLDAMVWSVGDVAGLEHEDTTPPDVPGPDDLQSREELWPDAPRSDFAFWNNFDQRGDRVVRHLAAAGTLPPTWQTWVRPGPGPRRHSTTRGSTAPVH